MSSLFQAGFIENAANLRRHASTASPPLIHALEWNGERGRSGKPVCGAGWTARFVILVGGWGRGINNPCRRCRAAVNEREQEVQERA